MNKFSTLFYRFSLTFCISKKTRLKIIKTQIINILL